MDLKQEQQEHQDQQNKITLATEECERDATTTRNNAMYFILKFCRLFNMKLFKYYSSLFQISCHLSII